MGLNVKKKSQEQIIVHCHFVIVHSCQGYLNTLNIWPYEHMYVTVCVGQSASAVLFYTLEWNWSYYQHAEKTAGYVLGPDGVNKIKKI